MRGLPPTKRSFRVISLTVRNIVKTDQRDHIV